MQRPLAPQTGSSWGSGWNQMGKRWPQRVQPLTDSRPPACNRSIRSKIKKRLRTVKRSDLRTSRRCCNGRSLEFRQRVDAMLVPT